LTVVAGHSERIMAAVDGNEEIASMAAAIQRAAERGARLTGQLLAFSRRQNLRTAVVTADRLLTGIDDLIRRATGETIEMAYSAAPDLWPMLIDPAQFESSLLNLVVNARDAMPSGGRLTITVQNAPIGRGEASRLEVTPGDYIRVAVADTGTGMPPEMREHAFEPFFTTKDVGKGTGLGLAQVYGFVKQSGGAVTIDSAPGDGTTISLYLPRAIAGAIAAEAPSADTADPLDAQGKTILVVEDQPDVLDVIELSLRASGYRVLTAADGVAASRLIESGETVDLLLTDVVMPNGMSGIDLAFAIQRRRPDIRIVLMSGFPRGHADSLSRRFVFIEKPFRRGELADTVAAAFQQTR
jgi:CheY-like chemotaxis protein